MIDSGRKFPSPSLRLPGRAVALAAALAVLFFHARAYLPFIADDALISLRYARRLIQGQGLTWTPGERVEGYSNLLWILGCAGLGRLGVDLILATRVLGLAGMSAALGAMAFAPRSRRVMPALAGMMTLALADPIACWSIGGLEQGLVAGLLAWALVLGFPLLEGRAGNWRRAIAPGALLGLLNLARPDGPLFTVAAVAALVLPLLRGWAGAASPLKRAFPKRLARKPPAENEELMRTAENENRRGTRRELCLAALTLAGVSGLFFLGQLVFRLAYYHEWVPNTAHVKLALSLARMGTGWDYVVDFARSAPWLLTLAAAGCAACLAAPLYRRRAVAVGLAFLLWAAYLVFIGGDIFPVHRHATALLVCLALLVTLGLDWALGACRSRRLRLALALATALLLAWPACRHLAAERGKRPLDELWEWDGKIVGEMLRRTFGERQPFLAVDAAGCLPYFSDLPSLDMLGLNDYHIAHHRRSGYQPGKLAHDMGDGQYVFDRRPDVIVFNSPYGGYFPQYYSGAEMMLRQSRFKTLYKAVAFHIAPGLDWNLVAYIRAEGGRIGIERTADRVAVPGYLFTDNPRRPAVVFDRRGRPMVEATPDEPAMLSGLALAAGAWRVEADCDLDPSPTRRLVIKVDGRELAPGPGAAWPVLRVAGSTSATVNLALQPGGGRAAIRSLTLTKMHGGL